MSEILRVTIDIDLTNQIEVSLTRVLLRRLNVLHAATKKPAVLAEILGGEKIADLYREKHKTPISERSTVDLTTASTEVKSVTVVNPRAKGGHGLWRRAHAAICVCSACLEKKPACRILTLAEQKMPMALDEAAIPDEVA